MNKNILLKNKINKLDLMKNKVASFRRKLERYNRKLDAKIENNRELNSREKNYIADFIFAVCIMCPILIILVYIAVKGV